VHILNASTGAYVGAFQPTSALGVLGEVDTSNGINAVERSNGEYEIMVEEDALAKQILYRWSPNGVTNGTYTLTPGCATGLRLDVAASGTASGTNVDIYTASGGNNQAWTMTNVGGNIYKLNPVNAPGLALNVVGGVNANGTNVDVETDNGSTSQRWILVPVSTGGYTLSPVCATNRSLDVYGAHNTNSSNVDIWGTNGNSSQNWTITPN